MRFFIGVRGVIGIRRWAFYGVPQTCILYNYTNKDISMRILHASLYVAVYVLTYVYNSLLRISPCDAIAPNRGARNLSFERPYVAACQCHNFII